MHRRRAIALFCTLATLWGLSFPAISIGLDTLPPLLFAAFRYDVAAVLLLGYVLAAGNEWRPAGWNDFGAIVAGGVFLVAGNGLLFVGQQVVPSGVAGIFQALVPIITALWGLALLDERLSAVGAVGTAVGLLGVGLIVRPDPANLLAGDTLARLLVLGQVTSVALGGVLVERANPSMGRTAMTGWAMALGAVLLHAISAGAAESLPTTGVGAAAVGAVAYLGIFSTAIAFLIYFSILERRGAFEASLVAYVVPIVATVAGVIGLGETIGPLTVLGFGVVAVGFAVLKRETLSDELRAWRTSRTPD